MLEVTRPSKRPVLPARKAASFEDVLDTKTPISGRPGLSSKKTKSFKIDTSSVESSGRPGLTSNKVKSIKQLYDTTDESSSSESSSVDIDEQLEGLNSEENKAAESEFSPENNFFASTPYFDAYVEKEVYNLMIVIDTMEDIGKSATTFAAAGSQMATATRQLSLACRLRSAGDVSRKGIELKRKTLGPEMSNVLERLGEILDEIATAQENMCHVVENYLGTRLRDTAVYERKTANRMHEETARQTESGDLQLFKYINGKQAASDSDLEVGSLDSKPEEKQPQRLSSLGFARRFARGRSENTGLGFVKRAGNMLGTSGYLSSPTSGPETFIAKAAKVASWKQTMEQIRAKQTDAELKRFRFSRYLIDARHQHTYQIGERTAKLFIEMKSYFEICSGMLTGLTSSVAKNEEAAEKRHLVYENRKAIWKERENALSKLVVKMKAAESAANLELENIVKCNSVSINPEKLKLDIAEEDVKIWELPQMLAESARYRRATPPGVIIEGWLYQKQSFSCWNKVWIMLKNDGIYCLKKFSQLRQAEKNNSIVTLKVCDIVLCTVRELPHEPNARFVFELIITQEQPVVLQAKGPKEYKKWVSGIRTTLETQLIKGQASKLEPDLADEFQQIQQSKEIRMTVLERTDSMIHRLGNESISNSNGPLDPIGESEMGEKSIRGKLLDRVMEANPTCADCGSQCPDWASLNLGILVCLECSGVHRSLGVHVSKVRSITLDSLSDSEASLLLALGNKRVNKNIWEKGFPTEKQDRRATSSSERQKREQWIRCKYIEKEFLDCEGNEGGKDMEKLSEELYDAVKTGKIVAVARALACGADMNWVNESEGGTTAVNIATFRAERGYRQAFDIVELLLHHGANWSDND